MSNLSEKPATLQEWNSIRHLSGRSVIWIDDNVVGHILTHDMALAAVSAALAAHAAGDVIQPLKPYVRPQGRDGEREGGRFIAMPAFVGGSVQAVGLKWIASVPANIDRGLARASGLVVLNDIKTGVPIAVLECATLSARRTAAVAALSFDALAPFGKRTVSIIGAGPINGEVIAALASRPRDIQRVHIFDLRRDRAEALAEKASAHGLDAACHDTAESCIQAGNVIIAATTGAKSFIKAEWLAPAWLIIALSLDDFEPAIVLSADKLICDDYDQCVREEKLLHKLVKSGQFDRNRMYAELGEVVTKAKPGREGAEKCYVNPMGLAIEDISAAVAVYREYASRTSAEANVV